MRELAWKDCDGDSVRFSADPDEIGVNNGTIIATISIKDGETGAFSAVYVDEQDAREIIQWLSERLGEV